MAGGKEEEAAELICSAAAWADTPGAVRSFEEGGEVQRKVYNGLGDSTKHPEAEGSRRCSMVVGGRKEQAAGLSDIAAAFRRSRAVFGPLEKGRRSRGGFTTPSGTSRSVRRWKKTGGSAKVAGGLSRRRAVFSRGGHACGGADGSSRAEGERGCGG